MITFSSKYRSTQDEIMDDFNLQGEEMETLLTDLKNVNKWLGGNEITISGISKLLNDTSTKETITILDVGCGDGELLRVVSEYVVKRGFKVIGIGMDFNEHILNEARIRSEKFPNLSYIKKDVFTENLEDSTYDIALCTLFLHHFSNDKIVELLTKLTNSAQVGVVVNDLQRSRLAFNLFKIVGGLLLKTKIARHDGLVSIARGFRRKDLQELSRRIPSSESLITWRWAFRYQWILKHKN